jgi:rare lipoprotein A
VRVTNLENGRSLIVRVNDRGPFHDDRLIDLSYAAAVRLGVHVKGTAQVEVRAIVPDGSPATVAAPPVAAGFQWLQVASFGERGNARKLEGQLGEAGFHQHRVVAADLDGRKVWRVQVGPLADEAALRKAERALLRAGFGAAQRVRQ